MFDWIQTLVMGIINIIMQIMGLVLVIYSAIIGTLFGGLLASSGEQNGVGYIAYLCVAMILTVVFYTLLIALSIIGSVFIILAEDFLKVTAIVFLIISEVLIVVVVALNVGALAFSHLYEDSIQAGPEYFSYFYILNVVVVIVLIIKFIFQLAIVAGLFPFMREEPHKRKSCLM